VGGGERAIVIDERQLLLPASAVAAGVELRVDLLISADERTILATLLHRAWTPHDATRVPAYPEVPLLLAGRGR
jgi:hypothetical protein